MGSLGENRLLLRIREEIAITLESSFDTSFTIRLLLVTFDTSCPKGRYQLDVLTISQYVKVSYLQVKHPLLDFV